MAQSVTVFNQPGWIFCRRVEEFLTQHGVPFQARNVAEDPAAMAELEGLGVATTPVTVIDGEVVVGFDRKRLASLLGVPETWRHQGRPGKVLKPLGDLGLSGPRLRSAAGSNAWSPMSGSAASAWSWGSRPPGSRGTPRTGTGCSRSARWRTWTMPSRSWHGAGRDRLDEIPLTPDRAHRSLLAASPRWLVGTCGR